MTQILQLVTPKLSEAPERVLLTAAQEPLSEVLVIGWDENGKIYVASSTADIGANLRLAETFKHGLLNGDFNG